MNYATQQDMVLEFGDDEIRQLTDRNNTGEVDTGILTSALNWADAVVNDHIRGLYSIPLDPVPVAINRVAMELAWVSLHNHFRPEVVADRKAMAFKYLEKIRSGVLQLDATSLGGESTIGGAAAKTARDRAYTKSTLGGF